MHTSIPELKKLSLLFIEDKMTVQQKMNEMLSIFFGRVLIANNGEEALMLLQMNHIDLVLSDIEMPIMDGVTLVKTLRLLNNKVPFIMLSSFSDQDTLLDATNAGIDDYIVKPIQLDNLIQTFLKVLMLEPPQA